MAQGAQIVHATMVESEITLWCLVDTDNAEETRRFQIFGTGWDDVEGTHVATTFEGDYVWHIFEVPL